MSPRVQTAIGGVGVVLGLVWVAVGATARGVVILLVSGAAAVSGLFRWRKERRPTMAGFSVDDRYLVITGLMFLAVTGYACYRGVVLAGEGSAMRFVALATGLLGLSLTIYTFGGALALRRSKAGRTSGALAKRLYPVLAREASNQRDSEEA